MDAQQLQELFAFADNYRPPEHQLPVRLQPFLPDYVSLDAVKPVAGCCHLMERRAGPRIERLQQLHLPFNPHLPRTRSLPSAHPTPS